MTAADEGVQAERGLRSVEVRERLVQALRLDLVGPRPGLGDPEERLPGWERPSRWYLTGFLVPMEAPVEARSEAEDEEDEALGTAADARGLPEESSEEARPAFRSFFPSSVGLTCMVRPGLEALEAVARWGDYARVEEREAGGDCAAAQRASAEAAKGFWQRTPHEERLRVALPSSGEQTFEVPGSGGLQLVVSVHPVDAEAFGGLVPRGTRSVSAFLVNRRPWNEEERDRCYAFQAELELRGTDEMPAPFVARPDPRGAHSEDWDERVADLHYADRPSYATGHGVAATWTLDEAGRCTSVRTDWVPQADVPRTRPADLEGVETRMRVLGRLADGAAVREALGPLVEAYRAWIEAEREKLAGLSARRRETAEELLQDAERAAERLEAGVAALADDPQLLEAFRVANRAVARALQRRLPNLAEPRWRPFQLAFVLLNLPGLADPEHEHREVVDLLFFPTGGGKTEAYLGLAAVTMVLRRLRRPEAEGRAGAGVAVLMRYTLRLLTLDQLVRAAGLVCALELERRQAPERYGRWPFEIGLWVGKAATPNKVKGKGDSAEARLTRFCGDPDKTPAPIPLQSCPWCGTRLQPNHFNIAGASGASELRVGCANDACEFSGDQPLPIVAVDESIYRRLPAFLVATVDKFAALPWTGPSGMLLGGAERFDAAGFYGPAESGHGQQRLPAPLAPPDLVIQDELHLVSGPLGTMVALYETAIEGLAWKRCGARPKIVASTATVRQAHEQVQALFGRTVTAVFPPPGPRRTDAFFAREASLQQEPGRRYVGIAAPGRSIKVAMRRVFLTLLCAAQQAWRDGGAPRRDHPADPYMTLLGYFNALRELGGARRILEEEVQSTAKAYGARRRLQQRGPRLLADRTRFSNVYELTSRVPMNEVAATRERLGKPYADPEGGCDWVLATNMISVGLDVPRLGLMAVLGQPKSHAEYIQATSRVGRDPQRPGLVVAILNAHRPRDRSHFERFRHYHETFYRSVEAGSVTPFAARALDRGLAGAVVALARHLRPELTPPAGAGAIASHRAALEEDLLQVVAERVRRFPFGAGEASVAREEADEERRERQRAVEMRIRSLLEAWERLAAEQRKVGGALCYQRHEEGAKGQPLLRDMLDTEAKGPAAEFRAPRSMRDVEPETLLRIVDFPGQAGQTGGAP